MFAHADEDVYSKLVQIIWKHGSQYKNIIVLMGGFHQLRVRQRLIYKRRSCMGYKDWFIDSGTISAGSADQAFQGKHYYRCMRVLKEAFDALVQFHAEDITKNYKAMDEELLVNLVALRQNPSSTLVEKLVAQESFKDLFAEITSTNGGTERSMTVAFLQDVSSMLALVSAVRDNSFEKHLQAEREMLRLVFAFDHQNYARYLSYQHVMLNNLKSNSHAAYEDLRIRGFGANYSGEKFATVHGDLVTEYFKRETKGTAGPFRSGYSTNIDITNKWIQTMHIHAKLRTAMREKLRIKTSSTHKELTDSGKSNHNKNVNSLKEKLRSYKADPFSDGPAKVICTGTEVDAKFIDDVLNAPSIGNERFKEFMKNRLVDGKESFFSPIKKLKLQTGIEKPKKTPKAVSILKEDRQAFGLLVSKAASIEEAFAFPITTIPLSLTTPDGALRQGDKAVLRNFMIKESNSLVKTPPENGRWIIDGMALFRSMKPKETYKAWFKSVLQCANPDHNAKAIQVEIVNDQHLQISTKASTRQKRGESSRRVHIESVEQTCPRVKIGNSFSTMMQTKRI